MNRFAKILYLFLFTELTIGGGGRLFSFGPVTLRMILFAAAMLITFVFLLQGRKISNESKEILIFFLITIGIGIIVGVVNDSMQKLWWEDVKPLLYFLILPFFELVIAEKKLVEQSCSIIRISALVLAFAFFIILVLIHSGAIPFMKFYHRVLPTQEFFFRGEVSFFYKGFLFLCLGFLMFYLIREKHRKLFLVILLLAILLTLTRGFLLALCLTLFAYYAQRAKKFRMVFFVVAAIVILAFSQPIISFVSRTVDSMLSEKRSGQLNEKLLGDRTYSDAGRFTQIKEVTERVTLTSLFIGHGFGNGIPSREVHMEISYLEIFHKQGLLGLSFWAFIFWLLVRNYRAGPDTELRNAVFYSALFVFFQSITNQYMNNPIGLSVILFSFVSLRVLKE